MEYDINAILEKEIGYAHVPKNRGDDVHIMSWIGKDINNFCASTTIIRILNIMYPQHMAILQGEATAEVPTVVETPVAQCVAPAEPPSANPFGLSEEMLAAYESIAIQTSQAQPNNRSAEELIH